MNRTSRVGKGRSEINRNILAGLLAGIFLLAASAPLYGRDARQVGDWLCSRVFDGPAGTLALACDGFFGLRLEEGGKRRQDVTGLWKLSGDGIELTLFNRQDKEILMTVGKESLHGSLGENVQATLYEAPLPSASFRATGLVERQGGKETFTDASSGRSFPVTAPDAADGKFATVEMLIGPWGVKTGEVIAHSGQVPRFFTRPQAETGKEIFGKAVAGRYWLLPPMQNVPTGALRFSEPQQTPLRKSKKTKKGAQAHSETGANGVLQGAFEVSGPGLRMEGDYVLVEDKLTLNVRRDSYHNIKLMGAGALLEALKGSLAWRVSPRGLELASDREKLLLLPSGQ